MSFNLGGETRLGDSWKIVVESIEGALQNCLAKIGNPEIAPESQEPKEYTSAKNAALQQIIQNNLAVIENVLGKNSLQFNILASEMDAVSNALRAWMANAKQCQEKVTSMVT